MAVAKGTFDGGSKFDEFEGFLNGRESRTACRD